MDCLRMEKEQKDFFTNYCTDGILLHNLFILFYFTFHKDKFEESKDLDIDINLQEKKKSKMNKI